MQTPSEVSIRQEVGSWLDEAWNPDLPLRSWREALLASGWACPSWPTRWYGRGLPIIADTIVAKEISDRGAVGPPAGAGMMRAAPTILAHARDELKRKLLPPIVVGDHTWCQLFSEPGSGSDLAGLTTWAERDGDDWIVSGQKVWTTSADHAQYGMLLARTDWDVPKHDGLTYFALPMNQPGIEVRPIRQMNGYSSFNEVFLAGVRVPHENVIGDVNGGWRVALTTLAHERRLISARRPVPSGKGTGRTVDEALREAKEVDRPYVWYPQRAGRADLAFEIFRGLGSRSDAAVRQEVARLLCLSNVAKWTSERAQAARELGREPGAEGSIGKLHGSAIAQAAAHVHSLLTGAGCMLAGSDAPYGGVIAEILLSVPAVSIAGGTDDIQRNIIADRILGLPREPQVDRDIPFREVLKNTSRE
jgi:alkylation response protein AidB-like acyl-CoA dehydrogenase